MTRPAARPAPRCLAFAFALALAGAAPAAAGVDANTATQVELEAIAGIGPALAARIVEERRKSPFRNLEELEQRVRGVGPASLRRMQQGGLVVRGARPAGGAETIVGGASPPKRPRP